ncbi:hypothetical protein [Emticicia sp. W12TSBA100-4]
MLVYLTKNLGYLTKNLCYLVKYVDIAQKEASNHSGWGIFHCK